MTDTARSPRRPGAERGAAAIMAMFIMTTLFVLVMSGLTLIQLSKQTINSQLIYHGQAVNAAQAGLVDSLSWFRRQTTQPVASFDPLRDLSQTPPLNDTDDPSTGIVRDYEISDLGNVWGRYEVRKSLVRDASAERGKPGSGTIWQVTSVGLVYVRRDPHKAYNQYPNRQLGKAVARTEMQRMSLVPPGNAAICAGRADGVTTDTRTRVIAGSDIGIVHPPSTGSATVDGIMGASVTESSVSPYQDSIQEVFGVSQGELLGMADIVASDVNGLPNQLPAMSMAVVRGNAVFTPAHPLLGTGILVVLGDLTIQSSSYSNYNGLIYVTGDYEQNSPSQVSGTIIARGDVDILASGDFSEVYYDDSLLAQIQKQMGQYRLTRSSLLLRN